MREFIITVNSTVDLPRKWLEERNVPVVPLKYTIDGETYTDMYGLTGKEFFAKLREGHMSVTSQVNPDEAKAALEPFLKEGKDILHLGFSSGLSGTYNSMQGKSWRKSIRKPRSSSLIHSVHAWEKAFSSTKCCNRRLRAGISMRSHSG